MRGRPVADEGDRRAAYNLRRLRRARGVTLSVVGAALGFTHQAAHRLEAGEIRLSVIHLATLSQLFGVSVDEFLAPIDDPSCGLYLRTDRERVLRSLVEEFNRIASTDGRRALLAMAKALAQQT
jgi:transcriptional regulator with XRE-family HTH domain